MFRDLLSQCTSGVNSAHILESLCAFISPKPIEIVGDRRSLSEKSREFVDLEPDLPTIGCRVTSLSLLFNLQYTCMIEAQKILRDAWIFN